MKKISACFLLVSITLFLSISNNNAQTTLWAKSYGGAKKDRGRDIGVDSMSNSYIAGYFTDSVSFGNSVLKVVDTIHEDIFIVKLDQNGNPLWSHSICNGISNHADFPFSISVNKDGWVAITGEFKDYLLTDDGTSLPGFGSGDMFLALYDPNGNLQWAKNGGGINKDMGTGVFIDDNGMISCTGNTVGNFTMFGNYSFSDSVYSQHVYVAQYNITGALIWGNVYSSLYSIKTKHISGDNMNSIYVGGDFFNNVSIGNIPLTSKGADDGWIARFTSTGSLQWVKSFGSSNANSYESGYTLGTDQAGNVYVATVFKNDITFDGNTIVTGADQNVALAAFTSNGVYKWANVIKGSQGGQFTIYCLDVLAEDNVLLTGCFAGIDTVGIGNSVVITPSGDPVQYDGFIAAFSPINGDAIWATQSGGSDEDANYGLAGNHTGNAYAVGKFRTSGQFGSFSLTSNGESDIDVVKFHENTAVTVSDPTSTDPSVMTTIAYPNPTTGKLSVVIPANANTLKLVNALGQVVMVEKIEREGLQILDLMPFSVGVYYLQVSGDNEVYSAKVVKQD